MSFSSSVLCKPKRGGKSRNLSNAIRNRIAKFPGPSDADGSNNVRAKRPCRGDELRAVCAAAKIEDGNLRAAVRILSSDDEPAVDCAETLEALAVKHPLAPNDTEFLNESITRDLVPFHVTETDVKESIRSFPAGSSGGLDLLSPQHMKDLTGIDGDPSLLSNLTRLINIMFEGALPSNIARIIYGGKLIALSKKSGGIRPIAVGYVFSQDCRQMR